MMIIDKTKDISISDYCFNVSEEPKNSDLLSKNSIVEVNYLFEQSKLKDIIDTKEKNNKIY